MSWWQCRRRFNVVFCVANCSGNLLWVCFDFTQLFHTKALVAVLWLQDAVSQSKCWLLWLGLVMLCRGCFHSCCTVLLYSHCASIVPAVTALLTNSAVCCRLNLFRQTTISLKNNWQPWKVHHFSASFHFVFLIFRELFSFPVCLFSLWISRLHFFLPFSWKLWKLDKAAQSFQKVWKSGEAKKKE